MRALRQRLRGFTLIEIIVVIAVIGILASITAFGFGRFQAEGRDAQRSSATTVIVEALESYFDENGEYPSCPAITGDPAIVTTDILSGVDSSILVAPNAPSTVENSIRCDEVTVGGEDFFQYQGAGGTPCTAGSACLAYTLRYVSEVENQIIEIASRRSTPINSTGTISTLSATTTGFFSINLSWGGILEADGYRIQRSTNNTFSANLVTVDVQGTSFGVTGLTVNTAYYFRVTQLIGTTPGEWSNIATATTLNLVAPAISSATVASATSVTVNWNNVANEASYTLRYSTSSTFASSVSTITGIAANSTSRTVTGLISGTLYYFQVRAENGSVITAWSNTVSETPIGQGSISSTSASATCGTITVNWTAVAGAATYQLQRSTSSGMTSPTTINGATGTSYNVTGLAPNTTYYFTIAGVSSGGSVGAASTVASRTSDDCQTTITSTSPNACGQVTVNWSGISGATSYTIRYSLSSTMSSPATISGATGTSRVVTGLTEGTTYYFTVQAVSSGGSGTASAVASRLTSICPPGAHSVSRNTAVTDGLQASSNASCAAGTDEFYQWYANGGAWASGTGPTRQTVTYGLSYGQGVTLTVSVRCQTASLQSGMVAASNSVAYTRPGMNLSMTTGADGCAGSFCGRQVFADWNNVCGAAVTSMRIYATQYSYSTNFQPQTTISHDTRWKGGSGAGAPVTYNVNISCTSQSQTIYVNSIYRCTGCS